MVLAAETLSQYGYTFLQAHATWPIIIRCDDCGCTTKKEKQKIQGGMCGWRRRKVYCEKCSKKNISEKGTFRGKTLSLTEEREKIKEVFKCKACGTTIQFQVALCDTCRLTYARRKKAIYG